MGKYHEFVASAQYEQQCLYVHKYHLIARSCTGEYHKFVAVCIIIIIITSVQHK